MAEDSERFRDGTDDSGRVRSANGETTEVLRRALRTLEHRPDGTRGNGLAKIAVGRRPALKTPVDGCPRASPGSAEIDTTPVSRRGHRRRRTILRRRAFDEPPSTQLRGRLWTELVPWDDPDFVREYERAHEQVGP